MAENSKIEWTDSTWTPIRARNLKTGKVGWHCEHATTGCEFCYSEGFNMRLGTGLPFKPGHRKDIEIFLDEKMLLAPLRWKKPRMIFVCSMTDAFADFVKAEWLYRMFAVMALCPQHTFQVLTKRAERMQAYLNAPDTAKRIAVEIAAVLEPTGQRGERPPAKRIEEGSRRAVFAADPDGSGIYHAVGIEPWPLSNIWLGVSAERQEEYDERADHLRRTPAAVRFISFEPLLGHIEPDLQGIHWAIVGGESGPRARPMHPKWARRIRNVCAEKGVPYFFKQWGEWGPTTSRASTPDPMERWGKKRAGRLLDGREHNGMPERAALTLL